MSVVGPPIPDPIGALGRVDSTRNQGNQPGDHDHFQQRLDDLIAWVSAADPKLGPVASRAGLVVPPFALQWWRQRKGVIDILALGDSTDEGLSAQQADEFAVNGGTALGDWLQRLQRITDMPIVGDGYQPIWRRWGAFFGGWFDGRVVYDAVATAGSKILTSATGAFAATDVGSTVQLYDINGNLILNSTIASRQSATQVTAVATASGNTPTNGRLYIGSDVPWASSNRATDAWDSSPWQLGQHATGTASTQKTFEIPAGMTVAALRWHWMDAPGCGNFQVRADTGAWQSMNQARLGDNDFKSFTLITPATRSISIRAWTGAAAAHAYIGGITALSVNPNTVTRGLIVHNVAKSLFPLSYLAGNGAATTRPLAIISGSSGSINPELIISGMFTNDAAIYGLGGLAQFRTNLAAIATAARAVPGHAADVLMLAPFEQDPTLRDPAVQQAYRDALAAEAATQRYASLDIYDALAARGITGYVQANAQGMMNDPLHENAAGHEFIAGQVSAALATIG